MLAGEECEYRKDLYNITDASAAGGPKIWAQPVPSNVANDDIFRVAIASKRGEESEAFSVAQVCVCVLGGAGRQWVIMDHLPNILLIMEMPDVTSLPIPKLADCCPQQKACRGHWRGLNIDGKTRHNCSLDLWREQDLTSTTTDRQTDLPLFIHSFSTQTGRLLLEGGPLWPGQPGPPSPPGACSVLEGCAQR